jgi:hypothetical protein
MDDSMLSLDGLSPVTGKAVLTRFDGQRLQAVVTHVEQGQRIRLESIK